MTTDGPVSIYEASRLALARTKLVVPDELIPSVERACVISARALDVERVGVWLFDRTATALHCVAQYDHRSGTFTRGDIVQLGGCPAYVAAIESRKVVNAGDARIDPRTIELGPGYLEPLGITSMLDAPIFREGAVYGIVCHEHVGPRREFKERDVDFASSVADMLTTLFEQASRLAAEEELRRGERLRALGRLAASVAHDFNGVLAVLALKAGSSPEAFSAVEIGKRLVGKLLVFGQHVPAPPEVIDVREVLEGMAPFFDALSAEIKVELRLPDRAVTTRVRIARAEIEQVVLNLVFNARDASPPKSIVWVGLEVDTNDVVIVVRDRGTGMTPEVRGRIFEPFFTTKEPGRGNGMGLATVYGIVTSAGGRVGVDSEPGEGSVFTVRFPRVRE
jgi:two-component system, cell cycle sensor histidine kinase and response regulator CckA